jgi:hypothetical protein
VINASKRVSAFALALALLGPALGQEADLDLILGRWSTHLRGAAEAIAVQDGLGLLALGQNGVAVVDIRDPSRPRQIGSCPVIATHVAVSGNLAYAMDPASWLRVIDITVPSDPRHVGSYLAGGQVRGLALSGHHVYVANTSVGLEVIEVSNPPGPQLVATYPGEVKDSHNPCYVVVSGQNAYLLATHYDFRAGALTATLEILDLSDPQKPRRLGILRTDVSGGGEVMGVAISGQLALVATWTGNLLVIDIGDPANPRRITSYQTAVNNIYSVTASGPFAYLAGGLGLEVVNLSNPASPVRSHLFTTDASIGEVAVLGGHAYLANYAIGLQVMDLSDPAAPELIGTHATDGWSSDVAVSGGLAYLVDGAAELQVIDIKDPTHPQRVANFQTGGAVQAVAAAEDLVYVVVSGRLDVIQTSSSAVLNRIGMYSADGWITDVAVVDQLAYLSIAGENGGLDIIGVSDPRNPQRIGSYTNTSQYYANAVVVSGTTAYLATTENADHPLGRLELIDVSDAASPRRIGAYEIAGERAESVAVSGSFAYVGANSGRYDQAAGFRPSHSFEVVDVSDPGNPRWVSGWGGTSFMHLSVSGSFAYLANERNGLKVVDISDPTNPRRVGGNSSFSAYRVTIHDDKVFVAGGTDGLIILNKYTDLRIGPAIVADDGRLRLRLSGVSGQCVRVQRSTNLKDWEDWQTVTLEGTTCELSDDTSTASQRFYRAIEDNSAQEAIKPRMNTNERQCNPQPQRNFGVR